jgi:hypothetical protein
VLKWKSEKHQKIFWKKGFGLEAGLPDGLFSKPKIPILVKFGGPCNGKCCYIL